MMVAELSKTTSFKYVVESVANYTFSINMTPNDAQNEIFVLSGKILINNKEHDFTYSEEESVDISIKKEELKKYCKGNENSCNIFIKYAYENKWISIGYIQLPAEE